MLNIIVKGVFFMSAIEIILLILSVALASLFIVVRVKVGGFMGLITKTIASFGFVTSAIIGLVVTDATELSKWAVGLLFIGLLCGMIGDIILDLKVIYPDSDKYYLNTGMGSFFVGHIFYIVAFSLLVTANINDYSTNVQLFGCTIPLLITFGASAILTLMITLSSTKMMGLNFGKFKWQTIGYTFILCCSMIYTLVLSIMGGAMWLAFVGMVLFFLSDVVLSFQYFGGKIENKTMIAVNHGLYYAAQIVIVAVLFLI